MSAKTSGTVVVVGGGLAGLTAAALLARKGRLVRLFERSKALGGRARSDESSGFRVNFGPHALYRGRAAESALEELGVSFTSPKVSMSGTYALIDDRVTTLPAGAMSVMTSDLLSFESKLELVKVTTKLAQESPGRWADRTVADWLDESVRGTDLAGYFMALVRLTSYSNAPATMAADVAISQLDAGLWKGVGYPDQGWQSLVDGLESVARAAGVQIEVGARVQSVLTDGARVSGVRVGEEDISADAVVVAIGSPSTASKLIGERAASLAEYAAAVPEVRAAVLDLALNKRGDDKVKLCLGIDRPLYYSVHSDTAELGPKGGAVLHAALCPAPGEDTSGAEAELEAFVTRFIPDWRSHVVMKRFLPNLMVSGALPTAATGGLQGRPRVGVAELPGLYLAGDWVGGEAFLADAAFASARAAAAAIETALPRP